MTEPTEVNLNYLRVAKVKCLRSLLFHTRYFFKAQYKKKFVVGDPHRIICEALERVVSGRCKRLIINIAPRYGKTELAVKSLISHGLALNPAAKFIHLSYSDDLALDNSEHVKDVVSSPEYQALYPDVVIKKDSKAKNKWYTTAGGGVLARAAGGAVTGFGAGEVDGQIEEDEFMLESQILADAALTPLQRKQKFGGCIIIDDPIKPEDADSDVIRERVNSRFDSTIRNRVNSRNTPIVLIMQRLHPNDLAGYLQRKDEADDWEVISLPSINTVALPVPYTDPERSLEVGAALLPWKHTLEELHALEKSNELVFGRQHMQDPNPKSGLLFPSRDLNYFNIRELEPTLHDPDFSAVLVDPADEGGDDFATILTKLIDNRIYITDVIYNTEGTDHNEPLVVKLVSESNAQFTGVEGVMGWKETAERIRQELTEDFDYEGEFRTLRPRQKKHSRILNRASFIRNHFYFRDDWEELVEYAKFMRNLTSYQKIQEAGRGNKHDDAPDVCEMGAAYYERNHPHLWEKPKK